MGQRVKKFIPVELDLYLPPSDRRLDPRLNPPSLTLGSRIRYYRLKNGFTQRDVAERLGISRSCLTRFEKGDLSNINPLSIQKIANALDIAPLDLLPAGNELARNKHYIDYIIPPTSLGSRIKNLRLKQGIQQKDLAKRLGVSRACVCRYEKDITKPNGKILNKLARILKVGIYKLSQDNRKKKMP